MLVGQDLVHDVSQCVAHGASRRVLLYHGKVAVESTGTPGVSWDLVYSINTWEVLHRLGRGCIHMGVCPYVYSPPHMPIYACGFICDVGCQAYISSRCICRYVAACGMHTYLMLVANHVRMHTCRHTDTRYLGCQRVIEYMLLGYWCMCG